MTLRLTDDQAAALRAQADAEGTSMQELALRAVDQYLATQSRRARIDEVLDTELDRYAEALRRLGE